MPEFRLRADYSPSGDQPSAIEAITRQFLEQKIEKQVLIGVTGSGKTYTMANVIQNLGVPTLIFSHNKTLAAQLYREFKEFFPDNAVEYFVSYYDYYQPEAYVPQRDLYIEKDAQINDEIDRMRVAAVAALMERRDVIVVASVSCIYGLGAPSDFKELMVLISKDVPLSRDEMIRALVRIQYERNDFDLARAGFRVKGDVVDIHTAYSRETLRVEFFGDTVESIRRLDLMTGKLIQVLDRVVIYPAKLFLTTDDKLKIAVENIEAELEGRLKDLRAQGKDVEAYRLETRTRYDLEMLQEVGFCSGIENYSRHLSFRKPGETPFTLLDYFPDDFLCIVDESHQAIPQIGGMSAGDRVRKQTLVDFGFRLPSALDNRPLYFEEFEKKIKRTLFVSATPADWEIQHSGAIAEQLIRPTGLVDPAIEVRPIEGQVDDIINECRKRLPLNERVLVTTLTKKMAEDLTEYLVESGLKVSYIHSEVDTIERVEILKKLRLGTFDVLVGINLLREGIDLPEVSLVCILDADKMGFLRSERSLVQIIGRSARNVNGRVILYADKMTVAMENAIRETDRRRKKQTEYNEKHGITPQTIKKEIHDILERKLHEEEAEQDKLAEIKKKLGGNKEALLTEMEKLMYEFAENLKFEEAAKVRDELTALKKEKEGKQKKG